MQIQTRTHIHIYFYLNSVLFMWLSVMNKRQQVVAQCRFRATRKRRLCHFRPDLKRFLFFCQNQPQFIIDFLFTRVWHSVAQCEYALLEGGHAACHVELAAQLCCNYGAVCWVEGWWWWWGRGGVAKVPLLTFCSRAALEEFSSTYLCRFHRRKVWCSKQQGASTLRFAYIICSPTRKAFRHRCDPL